MNYLSSITIVGWDTRNWRHHKQALTWCKDFGFKPVTRHVFAGDLYAKERAEMHAKFKGLFTGKTEKFFFATFCKSCFTGGMRGLPKRKDIIQSSAFELVQMP